MRKALTLLFIMLLLLSSLVMVGSVSAESIPEPIVPEFTVKYADHSYDVAPTTTSTTNPYNNQTTTTTVPGYHVQNMTVDLTIKNQLIPPSVEGNKSYLLFYVRLMGHYGDEWIYPYTAINSYPVQSNSDYTIISFPTSYGTTTPYGKSLEYLQAGDQIDFQIKAILAYGYNYSLSVNYPVYSYDYTGVAASDWSETQTLTIQEVTTQSPSPKPTSTDTNMGPTFPPEKEPLLTQEQLVIIGVTITVLAVGLGLLLYLIKRR